VQRLDRHYRQSRTMKYGFASARLLCRCGNLLTRHTYIVTRRRTVRSTQTFRRHLKTFLFTVSYWAPINIYGLCNAPSNYL